MTNPESGNDINRSERPEQADREDWTVREGMDVLSYDGEKLGEVANATGNYVLVRHGFLFAKEYYVPADAIANVGRDAVYLTMTKQIALEQQWDKPPTAETEEHSTTGVVTGSAAQVAAESTEPQTGTFSASRTLPSETTADIGSGTYQDPRSGTRSVSTADAETALHDAEITNDAQETLSAGVGIPVTDEANRINRLPKDAKPIDQVPQDEPQTAGEPVPGDANPAEAMTGESNEVIDDERLPKLDQRERI